MNEKKNSNDEKEEKERLKDKKNNNMRKMLKIVKNKSNKEFLLNKKIISVSIIIAILLFAQSKINILTFKKEENNPSSNLTLIDERKHPSDPSEEIRKVKIAIYAHSISNGGIERLTALLANYLSTKAIFDVYHQTQNKKLFIFK